MNMKCDGPHHLAPRKTVLMDNPADEILRELYSGQFRAEQGLDETVPVKVDWEWIKDEQAYRVTFSVS